MKWLQIFAATGWGKFLALGIPIVLGGTFAWGYTRGVDSGKGQMESRIAEALIDQREEMIQIHQADMQTALSAQKAITEVRNRVNQIQRPSSPSIDMPPDWLRAYTDGVRAANASTGSAAPAEP